MNSRFSSSLGRKLLIVTIAIGQVLNDALEPSSTASSSVISTGSKKNDASNRPLLNFAGNRVAILKSCVIESYL